jgi:hypothetical protein
MGKLIPLLGFMQTISDPPFYYLVLCALFNYGLLIELDVEFRLITARVDALQTCFKLNARSLAEPLSAPSAAGLKAGCCINYIFYFIFLCSRTLLRQKLFNYYHP